MIRVWEYRRLLAPLEHSQNDMVNENSKSNINDDEYSVQWNGHIPKELFEIDRNCVVLSA